MVEKKKAFNILRCVFYFCWGLLLQAYEMVIPNMKLQPNTLSIIVIICLILFMLLNIYVNKTKLSLKEIIITTTFLLFISIVCWHSTISAGLIFSSFLMIFAFYDLPFGMILRTFVIFSGITIFLTLVLNKMGVLASTISFSDYRIRNSLGFIYYSYGSILYFSLVSSYLLIRKEKIGYIELVLLELINIYFFKFTNTRDPFFFTTIVLLYGLIRKWQKSSNSFLNIRVIRFICKYIYILAFLINIIMIYSNEKFYDFFNELVNGRLGLSRLGIEQYGISIWGTKLNFVGAMSGSSYFYIDSFFIQTLLSYGVIVTIFILVLFTMVMKRCIDNNDYYLVFIMCLMALDGVFEPYILWLWYTPIAFLIGKVVRDSDFEKE